MWQSWTSIENGLDIFFQQHTLTNYRNSVWKTSHRGWNALEGEEKCSWYSCQRKISPDFYGFRLPKTKDTIKHLMLHTHTERIKIIQIQLNSVSLNGLAFIRNWLFSSQKYIPRRISSDYFLIIPLSGILHKPFNFYVKSTLACMRKCLFHKFKLLWIVAGGLVTIFFL